MKITGNFSADGSVAHWKAKDMTEDEKYGLFANKYQVVVENADGKKVTIQHPFITIDECDKVKL